MREASKTNAVRSLDFLSRYCSGRVIDIGSGNDLVAPHAEPFDRQHGDASAVLSFRPPRSYDCVHSSHCLEHMPDVPEALRQWWELVKPGGHLILVVPDAEFYEQGAWPSIFNPDHRARFSIGARDPLVYDLPALVHSLNEAEVISIERQIQHYDATLCLQGPFSTTVRFWAHLLTRARFVLSFLGLVDTLPDRVLMRLATRSGIPVDQTLGRAAAQIQAVVRKR